MVTCLFDLIFFVIFGFAVEKVKDAWIKMQTYFFIFILFEEIKIILKFLNLFKDN